MGTLGKVLTCIVLLAQATQMFAENLSEDDAVNRAIAASPDLIYNSAMLEVQLLNYNLGIREYLPQLSISYSDNSSIVMNALDSRNKAFSVSVAQPIFKGGANYAQRRLNAFDLHLAQDDLEIMANTLEENVRELFGRIVLSEHKREILSQTRDVSKDAMKIIRLEVRLGSALELDLAQAELDELSIEVALLQTEGELSQMRIMMKKLLGMGVDSDLELEDMLNRNYEGYNLENVKEKIAESVVECNQELRKQEVAVSKAIAQHDASQWAFIPSVDLKVSANFSANRFPLSNPQYTGNLTFSFAIPEMPTKTEGNFSLSPGTEKSVGASIEATPLQSISTWYDSRVAMIALGAEIRKKNDMSKDINTAAIKLVEDQIRLRKSVALAKRTLELQQKKHAILAKQFDLGEVKLVDLVKDTIDLANTNIRVDEALFTLIQAERQIEAALKLKKGGLANFGGSIIEGSS